MSHIFKKFDHPVVAEVPGLFRLPKIFNNCSALHHGRSSNTPSKPRCNFQLSRNLPSKSYNYLLQMDKITRLCSMCLYNNIRCLISSNLLAHHCFTRTQNSVQCRKSRLGNMYIARWHPFQILYKLYVCLPYIRDGFELTPYLLTYVLDI